MKDLFSLFSRITSQPVWIFHLLNFSVLFPNSQYVRHQEEQKVWIFINFPDDCIFFSENRDLSDQEVYWKKGAQDALFIAAVRKDKAFFYEYSEETGFNLKIKEEFPSEVMEIRLKKNYRKAIVLNSVFDGALRIIVPTGADLKHSYFLEWDKYVQTEKKEEAPLVARIIVPAGGFLLDIITFPIQFVVGWTVALLYLSSKK